ncbi:hypothetical protein GRI69_07320 [Erythrobacter vulgaris]|uniref:Uncharacterized protein n=1 Tax=Qipengyuania vulgaris TaxID=291985 RepID=A0A844XSD8_9SPHN|nr:hypothetical protein [Qipengyuania vulgaris]MXO48063.1 hypothetical protein [Qipengyuania vulgaris]
MAKKRSLFSRWWFWLALVLLLAAGAAWLAYGEAATRTGETGTAYAARVGCSCRFVAGRSLEDCAKDKLEGMELVSLSANETTRSVSASIPFIASDTASYREGYGCVLQKWED